MRVLSRPALGPEIASLKQLLEKHRKEFSKDPKSANELISIGQQPTPENIKEFIRQSEFFKVLKKHDPKRFKLALKKFGTEIGK